MLVLCWFYVDSIFTSWEAHISLMEGEYPGRRLLKKGRNYELIVVLNRYYDRYFKIPFFGIIKYSLIPGYFLTNLLK